MYTSGQYYKNHLDLPGIKENSVLRVERRKWGNADERQVRRTRPKVIASCRAREWEPKTVGRLSRNELKMFHEQILSRNEAWFVKIRKQMTTEKKKQDDSVRLCI